MVRSNPPRHERAAVLEGASADPPCVGVISRHEDRGGIRHILAARDVPDNERSRLPMCHADTYTLCGHPAGVAGCRRITLTHRAIYRLGERPAQMDEAGKPRPGTPTRRPPSGSTGAPSGRPARGGSGSIFPPFAAPWRRVPATRRTQEMNRAVHLPSAGRARRRRRPAPRGTPRATPRARKRDPGHPVPAVPHGPGAGRSCDAEAPLSITVAVCRRSPRPPGADPLRGAPLAESGPAPLATPPGPASGWRSSGPRGVRPRGPSRAPGPLSGRGPPDGQHSSVLGANPPPVSARPPVRRRAPMARIGV